MARVASMSAREVRKSTLVWRERDDGGPDLRRRRPVVGLGAEIAHPVHHRDARHPVVPAQSPHRLDPPGHGQVAGDRPRLVEHEVATERVVAPARGEEIGEPAGDPDHQEAQHQGVGEDLGEVDHDALAAPVDDRGRLRGVEDAPQVAVQHAVERQAHVA